MIKEVCIQIVTDIEPILAFGFNEMIRDSTNVRHNCRPFNNIQNENLIREEIDLEKRREMIS